MERMNDKTHPTTNNTILTISVVSAPKPSISRRAGITKTTTNNAQARKERSQNAMVLPIRPRYIGPK